MRARSLTGFAATLSVAIAAMAQPEVADSPESEARPTPGIPPAAGVLAPGTRWATEYHLVESGAPGPTLFIVGGVHGDEPAGPAAARNLLCWPIHRGKLIVVPLASQPAVKRGTRRAPATRYPDLNRNFPRKAGDEPVGTVARALWSTLQASGADWVIDLHEGFDYHRVNAVSVGSSILYYPTLRNRHHARRMARAVNRTVQGAERRFALLRPPVTGSLVRAAAEQLGMGAMILETTRKDQPLAVRVEQHLLMLAQLLVDLDMLRVPAAVKTLDDELPPPAIAQADGIIGRQQLPQRCAGLANAPEPAVEASAK